MTKKAKRHQNAATEKPLAHTASAQCDACLDGILGGVMSNDAAVRCGELQRHDSAQLSSRSERRLLQIRLSSGSPPFHIYVRFPEGYGKETAPLSSALSGMNRRHLVFDLDGTISDPAIGIARSLNYALKAFGFEPIPDNGVSKYIGPPIDDAFRRIAPSAEEECIVQLVSKFRERYSDVGYTENVLYCGIPEALAYLVANGSSLGICTTKRVDFAERILKHFGIRNLFQFVNGGDVDIEKHQQLQYLLAENIINANAAMIGDRSIDIGAAHANGLQSVGVLWGHGTEAELIEAEAQLLLSSPSQLMELANAA